LHRPSSIVAEAIRACRTALFFEAKTRGSKVIQVTSALPSEGKSVVAGNLAVSIAQAGKRVVLIDGDLRRPQLSDNFALEAENGLTDILNGHCDPTDAIHATSVDNLDVIPAGPIPVNPAEALTLPEVDDLIDWLRERYDFVIIDTPPLLIVTDPSIIAGHVDGVLVTLKVRRKSKHNAREAMGMLRNIGANVVGLVINASDDTSASDGYKGYGYHRFGRHASRYTNESRSSKGASVRGDRPPVVVRGKNGEDRVNGEDGVQLHASSGNGAVGLLEEDDEHRDSDA
jgi:capsular exopolysaccharide synthesis family protein